MASADGRNFVSNRSQERSPVGAGEDGGSGKTVLSAAFASYVSYILGPQIFVLPSILPKAMTIEMIMSICAFIGSSSASYKLQEHHSRRCEA